MIPLSDAIELGGTLGHKLCRRRWTEPGHPLWHTTGPQRGQPTIGGTCVLAGALIAVGIPEAAIATLITPYPLVIETFGEFYKTPALCPVPDCTGKPDQQIAALAVHLCDYHSWGRAEIAAWLRTQEPAPAQEPETPAVVELCCDRG